MKPLRTIVAEDERNAREEIVYLLESCADVELVGQAENGIEALDLVRRRHPDLLLVDVQMPGKSGLELVDQLQREQAGWPKIVFLTAYSNYAVDAFNLQAVDYVLKPVERERLFEAISRVQERMTQPPHKIAAQAEHGLNKLSIKKGSRIFLVDLKEINCFRAEGGVISVDAGSAQGTAAFKSLDALERQLPQTQFFRCHRGHLVNLDAIEEVIPLVGGLYQLRLRGNSQGRIPVSRQQARELRKKVRF